MPKGYKIAVWILAIAVLYLGVRDYMQARWVNKELYAEWIQANRFMYDTGGGPPDPTKPPEPPPPFGF